MAENNIHRARDGRLLTEAEVEQWRDLSKCTPETAPLFDAGDILRNRKVTRAAKFICASCDVTSVCLEYALNKENELVGTWGGLTDSERTGHANGPVVEPKVLKLAERVMRGELVIDAPNPDDEPRVSRDGYDGPAAAEAARKKRQERKAYNEAVKARADQASDTFAFEALFEPVQKGTAHTVDSENLLLPDASSSYLADLFAQVNGDNAQ